MKSSIPVEVMHDEGRQNGMIIPLRDSPDRNRDRLYVTLKNQIIII